MTVDFDDEEAENAVYVKISQMVSNCGDEMVLSYDYGDGLEVSITLEKIFEDKELPGRELPRVLEDDGYIYADAYEFGLEPTKQSLNLLTRKYKN